MDQSEYLQKRNSAIMMAQSRSNQSEAVAPLKELISSDCLDPNPLELRLYYARCLQSVGQYQESANMFGRLYAAYPGHATLGYEYGEMLYRLGQYSECEKVYRSMYQMYMDNVLHIANRLKPIRYVLEPSDIMVRYVGELAAKLDYFTKVMRLGLIPEGTPYLVVIESSVSNMALLELWSTHGVRVIMTDTPEKVDQIKQKLNAPPLYLDYFPCPDGNVRHRNNGHPIVQKEWERLGKGPLFTQLPDGMLETAKKWIPDYQDKHVVLHVRSNRTYNDYSPKAMNFLRHAEIDTYIPAIQYLTDQGFTVYRIGDANMTPLPPMHMMYDLTQAFKRPPEVDVALIATSAFYFGTPSGTNVIPVLFGVPSVCSNWFPWGYSPYCKHDMHITVNFFNEEEGKFLNEKTVEAPLLESYEPGLFEAEGVKVINNTSEEILELAKRAVEAYEKKD